MALVDTDSDKLGYYDNSGGGFSACVPQYDLAPDASEWRHIVVIGSGSETKFYINGDYKGTSGYKSADGLYTIGHPGQKWAEYLDEYRMDTQARSADWIWAEYLSAASNTVFNSYGTVLSAGGTPAIINQPATNVSATGSSFNGWLANTGSSEVVVSVYWGETDGGANPAAWAHTNSWALGTWDEDSYPTTNITSLVADKNYYYTYGASNDAGNVMAAPSQYLITGELTVEATESPCRESDGDTGEFTVTRPESCTNEALTVYYALSGTATNGTHYTIAPASGSLVIAAGETNATVTVSPVWQTDRADRTVILTLTAGAYALGGDPSATVTLAEVIAADPYTWYPRNPNLNWNEAQNWYGEAVPGSGQVALFDGQSSSEDCNINANISVAGLCITNGYAGTITQEAGNTVTVGASHYTQYSGTFTGGDADMTVNGRLRLRGTAAFSSTEGVLHVGRQYAGNETILEVAAGATFNHNSGTVELRPRQWGDNPGRIFTVDAKNSELTLNHVIVNGRNGGYQDKYLCVVRTASGSTVIAEGDFAHTSGVLDGTWEVKGNLLVNGGAVSRHQYSTTGTITLNGAGNQTYAYSSGRTVSLIVDKPSGVVSSAVGNVDLNILQFRLLSGDFVAPPGTMDLLVPGTVATIFRFDGGTFDPNNGTLWLNYAGGWVSPQTLALNQPLSVNNLAYRHTSTKFGGATAYLLSGTETTLEVLGNFVMDYVASGSVAANGGTLEIHGDVTINSGANGGTSQIKLAGENNQTVTRIGGTPPTGKWTIDKTGGAATLASDLSLNGSGQDLDWTRGGLNVSSNTLTINDDVTIGADATMLGVTVADATTAGRLTAGGTVSGLANADLAVTVAAEEQLTGQIYTILSNNTELGEEFGSVAWNDSWKGIVDYTDNDGKNIRLMNIRIVKKGTMFILR